MKKAALHNLGCKVNAYETEAMEQMLANAGYEIVPFGEMADVTIINTCSVTNIADRKSRQMLHKAKKMNPEGIVIAAGCYVQAEGSELIADEAVDIVIGNNCKADLLQIIEEYAANHSNNTALLNIAEQKCYEELSINRVCEHARAYIKVQDGCNQFCSYCIIPYTRGRVRSRKLSEITAEITTLVQKGYQEFVLTGIHLSSYGIDLDRQSEEHEITKTMDYKEQGMREAWLLKLIQTVGAIDGVQRIRLGSLEPRIVTEEFAEQLASVPQLCPHFHLSLQSGCDATLKRMNRRYDTTEYERGCNVLRKFFVNPAITTDVIVGFPGETEEEFQQSRTFLERIHFYEMHVFKYSRRKGTAADRMEHQIDETVKTARSKELLLLEQQMSQEYRTAAIGTAQQVLLEEKQYIDGQEYAVGHTETYIKVFVPIEAFQGNFAVNKIVPVTIQALFQQNSTIGRLSL